MITGAETNSRTSSYVRAFSAGDILRSSVQMYRNNFKEFWFISAMPFLPLIAMQVLANLSGNMWAVYCFNILAMLGGLFITAAVTVAVSDVCLGQPLSVSRSYWRAFSEMPWKILGTGCLVWGVLIVGFLLLLVPGFVFSLWYLFAIPLVVLEQTSGIAALRRSRQLGKGCYLRNSGVYLLLIVVLMVPVYLLIFGLGAVIGLVGGLAGVEKELIQASAGLIGGAVGTMLTPIFAIGIVLLYYDMRVRKEAYNIQVLAEELRR